MQKISIKREQSQAGLSFAERKNRRSLAGGESNFRPQVKNKLLLLLALLMTAATGAWATDVITVTWSSGDTYENNNSKDGVTLSGDIIQYDGYEWQLAYNAEKGTFTTELGNFTKIEITGGFTKGFSGEGWSSGRTWTGNAAAVPFGGYITDDSGDQPWTITFTIEPASAASAAKHLITATYDKQTRSLEQPLPYATTVGVLYEAVTGEPFSDLISRMTALEMTLSGIGSTNTDVVSVGEFNGASTPVTVNADGKAAVALRFGSYAQGIFVSVTPPLYVTMKDGVKDADKWTVKVGEGQAHALPIGGLKDGDPVTLQYNGRLKVKGVKATSDAAPAKSPAEVTTAPTAATDVKAGEDKALLATAGVATGGTMMYKVTTENTKPTSTEGFSADVPTAKTLAAGTYYVWYYVKADDSHTDSEISATGIEVTIEAAGPKAAAEATAEDMGKVIGADGNIYADAAAATAANTTAVAKICYVGSDNGEAAPYNHGLALALSDANGGSTYKWKTSSDDAGHNKQTSDTFTAESGLQYNDATHNSDTYPAFKAAIANNSTAAPTGCSSWFLASGYQWNKMITAAGGVAALRNASNLKSNGYYWSSTEYDSSKAWYFRISNGSWSSGKKHTNYNEVRACLAF